MKLHLFHKDSFLLSEGPYWSNHHSELFWVDILTRKLCRKSLDGNFQEYELPETLTCFYLLRDMVYGATENGFCSFDLNNNKFSRIIDIESELANNRSNDGTEDGYGGFIFGTMNWNGSENSGSIYHVNTTTLTYTLLESDYFIPNGFAFNPDTGQLFIADSYLGHIYCYNYNPYIPQLTNKRLVSDIHISGHSPDGMCLSKDGKLWSAEWDGARLTMYGSNNTIEKFLII